LSSYALPLFPLGSVLFPGGLMSLKVFEARYLDLMSACIKTGQPFGVVLIERGSEVRSTNGPPPAVAATGVKAELLHWDLKQPGLMHVQCRGGERFTIASTTQAKDGLLLGTVDDVQADASAALPEDLGFAAQALRMVVAGLHEQSGSTPFLAPFQFDEPGWVANRWCEILPIPAVLKYKLMVLDDGVTRLKLVADFLKRRGIAGS
jgi:Lon protease-like protein